MLNELEQQRIQRSMELLAQAVPRPLEDLLPYARNQKDHDERQIRNIAQSIRRFGWRQPVVVDERNVIVIGHGRVLAARELGLETAPVVSAADLSADDIRELRILDNLLNESPWNQYFEQDMNELSFEGFDLNLPDDVKSGGGADIEDIVEDEPPLPPEKPVARRGDIWQMGEHRLMCGDSTDQDDVRTLCAGQGMQLLMTDPPYNVDIENAAHKKSRNTGKSIMNDNMPADEFIAFLTSAMKNACQAMAPGSAFYIFYSAKHHTEFEKAITDAGSFYFSEQLIWVKDTFVMGIATDYQWQHECCFYGWKEGAGHYFTDSRKESTVIEDENVRLSNLKKEELITLCQKLMHRDEPSTAVYAGKPAAGDLHPTVKPQTLIAPLIANSSKPGWNVLDLFAGSGSTMIACEQLGRKAYCMELDPHYCDVIIQRWETFTGKKAELLTKG